MGRNIEVMATQGEYEYGIGHSESVPRLFSQYLRIRRNDGTYTKWENYQGAYSRNVGIEKIAHKVLSWTKQEAIIHSDELAAMIESIKQERANYEQEKIRKKELEHAEYIAQQEFNIRMDEKLSKIKFSRMQNNIQTREGEVIIKGNAYKGILIHKPIVKDKKISYVLTHINSGLRICTINGNLGFAKIACMRIAELIDWEQDAQTLKNTMGDKLTTVYTLARDPYCYINERVAC